MAKRHYVASVKGKRKYPMAKAPLSFLEKGLHDFGRARLFLGDAMELLADLPDEVSLTLTSPPYNVGLDYNGYSDDRAWQDYLNWLGEIFSRTFRATGEGGRLVVNVPYMVKFSHKKRYFPLPDYQTLLEEAGFVLVDQIVWVKARTEQELLGVAGRSTAWGSWLSPSSPYARPVHELLLVAKKPGGRKGQRGDITPEEFKLCTTSAWFIPSASHPIHPAVFPEELVRRAVKLYTSPDDVVFDPFMGVGTVGKVAVSLGRRFIGAEVDDVYFYHAMKEVEDACFALTVK